MKSTERKELIEQLRVRREMIFKGVAAAERDLEWIAQDRESELEERAQEERAARLLARLDDAGKQEIEDIEDALRRIAAGTYGVCESCHGPISRRRLAALPAARLCIACARAAEAQSHRVAPRPAEAPLHHPGRLPADLEGLSGPEIETWIRDQLREDGRVDAEELRIVCRHGVVHLEGTLPSEGEHQILIGLIEDVVGLQEVVDRLEIREVAWEREERAEGLVPAGEAEPERETGIGTEDVVASAEEGISYAPPAAPTPQEE